MSKTAVKSADRPMAYVDITQAEEMPVLSLAEKTALVDSVEESRAQLAKGDYIELASEDIGPWLRAGLEKARQQRRDAK
ncbi:MAG: hypothetical protein ACRCWF_12575 [Beijerinckiaceae bacterium]